MTVALAVVGVLLSLAGLAVAFWWLRTQSGTAIRGFYAAVRKMEHEQGIDSRYQVPWLMLLGDPREGGQLCRDWQLAPVGRPSWFGRWWADQDAALLVVPQAVFLPGDDGNASAFVWRRLLGMLLRLRGQRPLDGVIWNIPLGQLRDEARLGSDALLSRRRFGELSRRLGLALPVYVLVGGLEELPGFQELAAALPGAGREGLLGWSSAYGLDADWQSHWLDDALDELVQDIQAAIIEISALDGELDEVLYRLPDLLLGLKENLRTLLDPVFQGLAMSDAPRLRGIYFCASQAPAPEEPGPGEAVASEGVFTERLWRQRILAERGLAQALPRILRLRQRWQWMFGGGAIALGLCWLVAMLWVWQGRQQDAHELSDLLRETCSYQIASNAPGQCAEQVKGRVLGFWQLLRDAPRWHFASLVYPTSWGSAFDRRMERLLRDLARLEAMRPLRQLQQEQLDALTRIRNTERRPDADGIHPEQWTSYVKARDLAEGVVTLERHNRLLNDALAGQQGVIEPLAQLGSDALGLGLDPASLRKRGFYDRTLQGLAVSGARPVRPLDLAPYRERLSGQFQALMGFWQAQYFLGGNFVTPAGYLKRYLQDLEYSRDTSLARLEEIGGFIGHLEELIVLTNSAWSHGGGEELVPGYNDLLDDVRQSRLLGPAVVASLDLQAERLRGSFHDQWIEGAASRDNLLKRQAGGTLVLQEHVRKLAGSIDALLKQDFAVIAMRRADSVIDARKLGKVDKQQLTQALVYQQSYKDFAARELGQVPPAYRSGMLKAAEEAAALAMWSALTASAMEYRHGSVEDRFDVPVEQAMHVIQALQALGRADLASTLQAQLTWRAMQDIDVVLGEVDSQPLFSERYQIADWDGEPDLGLKLYRAGDVQELQTFLARQFALIGDRSEAVKGELDWLQAQPELSPRQQEKVARLGAIHADMQKYKARNPVSTPALFEQLVSRDLVEMESGNCRQILADARLPQGDGDLARHTHSIAEQALRRCKQLQLQGAAEAWNALAGYFNQYLAGRFPFAYSLESDDADPARVRYLLTLIDTHLEVAEKGMTLVSPGNRLAAEDFLARMKLARNWLGPLLTRDKSGAVGVELEVRWRTDREREVGADQVISWGLQGDGRQVVHPGASGQRLLWNVGEPLQLRLRWAQGSSLRPLGDPMQPGMAVNGPEVSWEYHGPWALLRMMRAHVSRQRLPDMEYTDFPLTLQAPVRGAQDDDPQARMFMRLSLFGRDGRLPLSIQPLPVGAPISPFSGIQSHASAINEVLP